jgi:succinoglycan biosynthesis protein ExoM
LRSGEERILISVCIATYKRETLLENLLKSLEAQELSTNISLEIVVVDNDDQGSAKGVLSKFKSTEKILFKYFQQPIKNISLTRNLSVLNATGDFICFIDDDETASTNWIQSFYNAVTDYNADGAFGHIEPIFDKDIPLHLQKREYYFSTLGETGTEGKVYFTTNTIIKSNLIKSEKVPFDPAYGLTGGEDVHLFERLYKKGAKYINCKEAVTYEFIPKDRGSIKYIYKRALQGGQSFVKRRLEYNKSLNYKLLILVKAFITILWSILLFIIGLFSIRYRIISIKKFGASVGKIRSLLGYQKNMY